MGVSLSLVFAYLFDFIEPSTTAQVLGHVTFSLSYVVVIVRGRLFSIGRQYEEAAADLGATPWETLSAGAAAAAAAGDPLQPDDRVRDLDRRFRDQPVALLRRRLRHGADPHLQRDARGAAAARSTRWRRSWSTSPFAALLVAYFRVSLPHPRRAAQAGRSVVAGDMGGFDVLEIRSCRLAGASGGEVQVVSLIKRFGPVTAVRRHQSAHARRRVLLDARPVGLRQDDDAAHDRRLRAAERGQDPARRRGHDGHAAA